MTHEPSETYLSRRYVGLYLGSQVFSTFGTSSIWLTVALWVRDLTGSNSAAALSFFFYLAPGILSPVAGSLVDKGNVRRHLIGWNAAGVVCSVVLLIGGYSAGHYAIYATLVLYGIVATAIAPAQSVLLVRICPPTGLPGANSVLRTSQSVLKIVSPVAGAATYATLGPAPAVLLDAATFLVACGVILALPIVTPRAPLPDVRRSLAAELTVGGVALRSKKSLWCITVASAAYMLVAGLNEAAIWAVITESLRADPAFIGAVQFAIGVGSIVGGLAATSLIKRTGFVSTFQLAMMAFAIGNALLNIPNEAVVLIASSAIGISTSLALIAAISAVQTQTEPQLQGRVFGAFELIATGPQVVAVAVGATLLSRLGFMPLLLTGSAVAVLIVAWMQRAKVPDAPSSMPAGTALASILEPRAGPETEEGSASVQEPGRQKRLSQP